MDRLVSLAAGTVLDLDPAATVDVAAAAGFGGAGIWFDPETWTAATTAAVASRLGATRDHTARHRAGDPRSGPRSRRRARRRRRRARCPPRVGGKWPGRPRCGRRALRRAVRTGGAGRRRRGARVPADLHGGDTRRGRRHRGGGRPPQWRGPRRHPAPRPFGRLARRPSPCRRRHCCPYLQIADAPAESPGDRASLRDEALHGRLLPGEGTLPLDAVLTAVPGVPLSLELRSATLMTRFPDPLERARAVLTATEQLLGQSRP